MIVEISSNKILESDSIITLWSPYPNSQARLMALRIANSSAIMLEAKPSYEDTILMSELYFGKTWHVKIILNLWDKWLPRMLILYFYQSKLVFGLESNFNK